MKKHAKRIIYDIVGFLLIIISPFLGAIPGPGGIIIFFTGLSILAIHNHWARRLLIWSRANATNILDIIFTSNPKVQLLHDAIGCILLLTAGLLALTLSSPWRYTLPVACGAAGIFWLLYNRHRYKKFIGKA